MNDEYYMLEAIRLSQMAVEHGNEPYGAIVKARLGRLVYATGNIDC